MCQYGYRNVLNVPEGLSSPGTSPLGVGSPSGENPRPPWSPTTPRSSFTHSSPSPTGAAAVAVAAVVSSPVSGWACGGGSGGSTCSVSVTGVGGGGGSDSDTAGVPVSVAKSASGFESSSGAGSVDVRGSDEQKHVCPASSSSGAGSVVAAASLAIPSSGASHCWRGVDRVDDMEAGDGSGRKDGSVALCWGMVGGDRRRRCAGGAVDGRTCTGLGRTRRMADGFGNTGCAQLGTPSAASGTAAVATCGCGW